MKKEILNPKIKTALAFFLLGAVVITYGCKDKEPEKTPKPFVSESYVMVDEGVELRLKKVGNGPDTVIIPLAIYFEYEFEKLIDESRTLVFYDVRGRGRSSGVTDTSKLGMDFEISDLEALRLCLGKERIRDLNVPVLSIHGAQDPSCPLDGARTWMSWLQNGRLVVIPKAGHMPFIEQPEMFYPSVDIFLKGEWPESAEVLGVPVPVT